MSLSVHKIDIPFLNRYRYYLIGSFFNNFMPSSIGGDVVRIAEASKYTKLPIETGISVIVERSYGLITTVAIGATFIIANRDIVDFVQFDRILWPSIFLISFFLLIITLRKKIPFFMSMLKFEKVKKIYEIIILYKKHQKTFFKSILFSSLFQLTAITFNYAVAYVLNIKVPFVYFFMFVPIVSLAWALPISVNGIGVRECAYVYLFSHVGMSTAEALSLSFMVYLIISFSSIIGGIIYMYESPLKKRASIKCE
jgi:hypothetical protein